MGVHADFGVHDMDFSLLADLEVELMVLVMTVVYFLNLHCFVIELNKVQQIEIEFEHLAQIVFSRYKVDLTTRCF